MKSGIIKKVAKLDQMEDIEAVDEILLFLPELILVGAQKFHKEELGYNPDNEGEKEQQLGKVYAMLDDYFDGEDADVQVLYNALEIPIYENNGYNWVATEKTLMQDYLKVKKLKGTLVGVEDYLTEDCKQDLNESEMAILPNDSSDLVKIDFSEFTSNVTDISKYLGNTITVYYEQLTDKDDRKLIIIDDETTKNSESN